MKYFISIALSFVAIGIAVFSLQHISSTETFGATGNAGANALYEQALSQPLGTTDANMFVTSGADVQGNLLPLNSYQCLSVDTGQPNFEAICGNVTASSAAGLTLSITLRGLSTQTGTTSNPSFIFTHRRGADVRITDFPTLTVNNNELNGVQQIPNELTYANTVFIGSNDATSSIPTKFYVDNALVSGAVNATTLVKGIVQLATPQQAASSTILGSTGANDVLASKYATDTPQQCSGQVNGGCVVMSALDGFVRQSWFNFANLFTFTGGLTSTATSTFACSNVLSNACKFNGTPLAFQLGTTFASSTFLSLDAAGNVTAESTYPHQYAITNSGVTATNGTNRGYATSTPFMAIPAGFMTASSTIRATGVFSCNAQSTNQDAGDILLKDSLGDTLGDVPCTTNATNGNITGTFEIDLSFSSSVSNETTLSINGGIFLTVAASTVASDVQSTITTNTINLGNAFSVGLVASAQSGGGTPQTILNSFNIVATK